MTQKVLKEWAQSCSAKVAAAVEGTQYFQEPYKHVIIDNFFPSELAEGCLKNFPPPDDPSWERTNDPDIEVKLRSNWKSEFDIPDVIDSAVRILNSAPFLLAMSNRIGIEKIVADPYFSGGGLNATVRGGLLDIHVDGNYHDATGLNRRLNALVYLNKDWKPEYGGEFGIYDSMGEECLKRVEPVFNRLVIFDSHDFSFHGLPDPLNFPDGESRKSIILYYYTKSPRPSSQVAVDGPHSALWKKRNMLDKRGNKTRSTT